MTCAPHASSRCPGPHPSGGLAHQAAAPPLSSYNGTVGQSIQRKKERLCPGPHASGGLAHQAAAPPLSSYNGTVGQSIQRKKRETVPRAPRLWRPGPPGCSAAPVLLQWDSGPINSEKKKRDCAPGPTPLAAWATRLQRRPCPPTMGQWANQFREKKERLCHGPLASCGLAHQAAAPPLSSYNGTADQRIVCKAAAAALSFSQHAATNVSTDSGRLSATLHMYPDSRSASVLSTSVPGVHPSTPEGHHPYHNRINRSGVSNWGCVSDACTSVHCTDED